MDNLKPLLKSQLLGLITLANLASLTTVNSIVTLAAPEEFKLSGERLQFTKLEGLVSTVAVTLQYFAGGIAIIFVIFNGIKIMTSSDSHRAMEEAKSGMFKIFLGCAVVFLAATIVGIFFKATT